MVRKVKKKLFNGKKLSKDIAEIFGEKREYKEYRGFY